MTNQVANTILAQLGGQRFVAMTGASNLLGSANGLSFKVGRNDRKVTHVRVTLNARDLYDIEYLNIRGTTIKTVGQDYGICCEGLAPAFTEATGLRVSL